MTEKRLFALMSVLVTRLGGHAAITAAELAAVDPRLRIRWDADTQCYDMEITR